MRRTNSVVFPFAVAGAVLAGCLFTSPLRAQTAEQKAPATQAPAPKPKGSGVGRPHESERDEVARRQEWFYRQRRYPYSVIPGGARQNAIQQREASRKELVRRGMLADGPNPLTGFLLQAGLPQEDSGPEAVAPMVVYLASAACAVSGEAFSAGGRRFGRVFIGVADGWISPAGASATAEDIAAHLPEIEDLGSFATPGSAWEELGGIGRLRGKRDDGG